MRNPVFHRREAGFSLVELMVGVTIALIATIIMFQVFGLSERQRRVITGASDAQVNGALAIDMIEREARSAGFGGVSNSALSSCANTYTYYDTGEAGVPAGPLNTSGAFTQPVTIISNAGKDIAADSIVIKGISSGFSANYLLPQACISSSMPQSSSELKVASTYGFETCALMMVVQTKDYSRSDPDGRAGNCTLMQITHVQPSSLHIQHNPASSGPTYNPKVSYQNANNWPAYKASASGCEATAVCVQSQGSTTSEIRFEITSTNGVRELVMTANGVSNVVAPHIMDMQAEYGVVIGSSGVPIWQPAIAGGAVTVGGQNDWSTTATHQLSSAQINSIKAIRVALIARSGEFEKPTNAAGTCDTTLSTDGLSTWATFDTSKWPTNNADPSQDWRCYRYKVFETVIPLRNVIWASK